MRRTSVVVGCVALALAFVAAGDPAPVSAEVICEVSCHQHGGTRGKLEEAKSEFRKAKEAAKEAYEASVEEIRRGCDECIGAPPAPAKIRAQLAKAKARYESRLERAKARFQARVSRIEEGRDSAAEVEREQREEAAELEAEAAEIAAEGVTG